MNRLGVIQLVLPPSSTAFDAFRDAVADHALRFRASDLREAGFEPEEEVSRAVARAMQICSGCGVPIREHFKTVYVGDHHEHTVSRDWMLSRFAYTLVVMNGAADNPLVSRLQFQVIKNLM